MIHSLSHGLRPQLSCLAELSGLAHHLKAGVQKKCPPGTSSHTAEQTADQCTDPGLQSGIGARKPIFTFQKSEGGKRFLEPSPKILTRKEKSHNHHQSCFDTAEAFVKGAMEIPEEYCRCIEA